MAKKANAKLKVAEALDDAEQEALELAATNGAELKYEKPEVGDEAALLSSLKKIESANEKQLKKLSEELIKLDPNATPKSPQEIRGVYQGIFQDGKYKAHFLSMLDEGRPVQRKIRAGHVLNRQLAQIKKGTPVVLYYTGKAKGEGGRSTNLFDVATL